MKTRNIFSVLFALAMTAVAFTSCQFAYDPLPNSNKLSDKCESKTLSGQWYGNWGSYYRYKQSGMETRYDSYKTDVVFYQDYAGASRGTGVQVDWYNNGPYSNLQYRFNWSISNGVVYLHYPFNEKLNCYIRDYRMSDSDFTGYFSNGLQRFSMRKIIGYYNWDVYTQTYSFKKNTSFGGYFTRSASISADDEGEIVGYGNSFADAK